MPGVPTTDMSRLSSSDTSTISAALSGNGVASRRNFSKLVLVRRAKADRWYNLIPVFPDVGCGFPKNAEAHVPNLFRYEVLGFRDGINGVPLILMHRVLRSKEL